MSGGETKCNGKEVYNMYFCQQEVEAFPPMRVEVYYEALCPDSRYFVVKHLLPTYNKLKDIITVALVPYGKASVSTIQY